MHKPFKLSYVSLESEEKIVDFLKSSACVAELTVAAKQSSFVNFFVVRCLKYVPVNCLTGCSKIIAFKNVNVMFSIQDFQRF